MIGRGRGRQPDRFLATILFTDIVGSTDRAAEMGDAQWRRVIAAHHATVRAQLRKFGGHEIDTAGDGFLCSFDQPAQAVRAADAILAEVARLGLTLRAGLHTGEAERVGGGKLGGIAVHIAARVMALAEGGQVLVSSTVRDLVAGSRLAFTDAGSHELKGVPDQWHLYSLVREMPAAIEATFPPAITEAADLAQATGRRRRNIALAAFAIVAIAVVGVGGAYALGAFKGVAEVVAVPRVDSVVEIDSASGHVVAVQDVPAGPVAMAYDAAAGRLWVASLDVSIITDFALTDPAHPRTTGRVGRPTGLAIGGGHIWVTDDLDKTVTLLDTATGQAQATIVGALARTIVFGSGSAWTTDDLNDRVLRLDQQSGAVAQTIDLGPGAFPSGAALADGVLWIGNAGTSTLTRIDAATASVAVAAIALRSVPGAVAAGPGVVWVAATSSDAILRLDPQTNNVAQTIAVGDQPISIAADGDTVWVGCAGAQAVWHLSRDGEQLAMIDVRGVPTSIVVAGNHVYVTVRRP
ncbi:MAG: adenylate/guanylate cyclase domain-containing protein [Chloroflexota bacterium]